LAGADHLGGRAFADQPKRLRRAKSSIRSAALATLAAGPVIRLT
jgi:hypothetical protein